MEKILRYLNLKLDHVVVKIKKSKDLKKLMGSLQAYEQKIKIKTKRKSSLE